MAGKDQYYNKAKQEGYRSRAAYKLKQLDAAASLIGSGDTVVDLGAAPGGWLQVAAERAGADGAVVGVDRQRIDPIDGIETIRGDITESSTKAMILERVGTVDVVLSDMAPDMTGEYSVDHARSVHLARQALEVAKDVLAAGGDVVVKVFEGPDLTGFRSEMEEHFEYVRSIHPDASRDASSEVYLVGKSFLTAPVRPGEELEVEITDQGAEGDGVASVEGFRLFVPDAAVGDDVRIRVTDVKSRFGFAERLE